MTTLSDVADAVALAHGWCNYHPRTNETYGPYKCDDLDGPTTAQYYNMCRTWNTQIAVALAEEKFDVDLSNADIVDHGPWRDTVRSIRDAILADERAEAEFAAECAADAN